MLEERIGVEGETEPKSEKGNSNKNKTSSQFSFSIHSFIKNNTFSSFNNLMPVSND
jgi:hypothetical protein